MDGSCGKKDIKESQQLNGSTNSKRRYRNINKYREFYNPNRTIGTRNKRGERMKIEELKKAIDSIGFDNGVNLKVTEDIYSFYIKSEIKTLAVIDKSEKYLINTYYHNFLELEEELRQTLFDIIYKFASTPISDREEEKRYIIPLPHLVTTDGEQQYLTHSGSFFASRRDKKLRQTWKEEHLKYVPEEYRKYAVEVEE